jgi:hypothetical protein
MTETDRCSQPSHVSKRLIALEYQHDVLVAKEHDVPGEPVLRE